MDEQPLGSHLPEYLDWLRSRGRSPHTVRQYRHKVGQLLRFLGDRPPTAELMYAFRFARQEGGRRPATVICDLTACFGFFAWLTATKRASGLPRSADVEKPSRDQPLRAKFREGEVSRLFQVATEMPAHTERTAYLRGRALAILALMAGCGLRRGEVLAVNVSDLQRDSEPWVVRIRLGKGAETDSVPIGEEARALLEEWLAIRRRWCFRHQHVSDALLPVDRKRRMAERCLMSIWYELIERAGFSGRGLTPHSLRHWYGTYVAAHEDLPTAQRLLRHKRMETTFVYLSTDDEKVRRAANAVSFQASVRPTETRQPGGSTGAASQAAPARPRRQAPGRGRRLGG